MVLRELGWEGMDWIHLAKDGQEAGSCECDNVLSGFIKFGEFLD
jgi:hypothetical protein